MFFAVHSARVEFLLTLSLTFSTGWAAWIVAQASAICFGVGIVVSLVFRSGLSSVAQIMKHGFETVGDVGRPAVAPWLSCCRPGEL